MYYSVYYSMLYKKDRDIRFTTTLKQVTFIPLATGSRSLHIASPKHVGQCLYTPSSSLADMRNATKHILKAAFDFQVDFTS